MSDLTGTNQWMWVGKLAPPQVLVEAVSRDALLARLVDYRHMPVILITSPPGFGKTTLLAHYRQSLIQAEQAQPVAWLSLDEADQDTNRFLAYSLLALEGAGVDLQGLSPRAHSQALDADPQRTMSELIQRLEQHGTRITLVLDDYHRATCDAVDALVLLLLERAGRWIRLIVASRARPHWPLATLKARGLVHEIDANDLVFSLSEASQVVGKDLSRSELAIIHARTEGWAVALQLARLWLSRGKGTSMDLRPFSGQVAEIAEYLAEQVVQNLPQDLRDFLVETSVLERFDADLADFVRGRTDSAALLSRLAPIEALVVPLDAGRTWFRYHLMLADFLQPKLSAERAAEIHRAAARWLARQSDWVSAVTHALEAKDRRLATSLIDEAGAWELVLSKGIHYTQGLIRLFDDLSRRTEPRLLLMQAYLDAKVGREASSMELLRLAEVSALTSTVPRLRRDFEVISGLVHLYFDLLDDPSRWPISASEANERFPDDPLAQATALCGGAVSALTWGRIGDAVHAAAAARVRMQLVGSKLGENYCLIHLAQSHSASGQMAQSRVFIDEGLALAEANFGTDSSLKALVGCLRAQDLFWRGEWEEAAPWVAEGQTTLEHVDGWLDVFAVTAEISWRIAFRKSGRERAQASLDETSVLARRRSLPRLSRLVQAWRVDLLAQCGLLAEAGQEASAASLVSKLPDPVVLNPMTGHDWRYMEAATIAMARVQLASGEFEPANRRLQATAAAMAEQGLFLSSWRLMLLATVCMARGNGPVPFDVRERGLAPILKAGLHGFLLEIGSDALAVLDQSTFAQTAELTRVKSMLGTSPSAAHAGPLSAKEDEVVSLLIAGHSNKVIARKLAISENTVKFRLKQIYSKLGVESRSGAVAAALQMDRSPRFRITDMPTLQ